MYTRCPSCRSEISFDPPANKDSLPENYRHRIKCPSCGVTIGVKINQAPQILSQPITRPQLAAPPGSRPQVQRPGQQGMTRQNAYAPQRQNPYGQQQRPMGYGQQQQRPYGQPQRPMGYGQQQQRPQTPYTPPQQQTPYGTRTDMYEDPRTPYYPQEPEETQNPNTKSASNKKAKSKTKPKAKADNAVGVKKYGTGRNITMMVFSLAFVIFSAIYYLVAEGTLTLPDSFRWVTGINVFSGISVWASIFKDFNAFKTASELVGALGTFATIVPLLLFTLSCVNFIVAFVFAILKKYIRSFNVIFSLLIGGLAVVSLFAGHLVAISMGTQGDVIGYFVDVIGMDGGVGYMEIAGAFLGVLQIVFALIFTKSLVRKEPKEEKAGKNKGNAKSRKAQPQKSRKGKR